MTTTPQNRRDQADPVWEQRYDRVQMEAQLDPSSRTKEGYLRVHAAVAVPGIMEYEDADGNTTRELIPADELHNLDSLRSLAGKPITLGHPDEDVSPDNVGELGVGSMGNEVEILEESGHVRISLVLHRADALQAVNDGLVEVSPGYKTTIDATPGTHAVFGKYDAIQRRRRYNHLALVDEARGGRTVKLRADTARVAVRRHDAAPVGGKVACKHDLALPSAIPPTPAPSRGSTMNPTTLLALALMLSVPVTLRGDGKGFRRTDGEHAEITEEQLVAAITAAIRELMAKSAEGDGEHPETKEGDQDPEAMKAKIAELEAELEAMKAAKVDADAEIEEEQEKADRKDADALATRMRFDAAGWTDKTTATERRLDLIRTKGWIDKDAKPTDVELGAFYKVLSTTHPAAEADRADQWDDLPATKSPTKRDDAPIWGGGTGSADTGDIMADAVKRRNDKRLGRNQPTATA